jgi:DNA repair protein RecO (recombination protein O)
MEWRDEAIVLSLRPHGESAAIVTMLTPEHGRHAGLARGADGRRGRSLYQTGNRVQAVWRARLGEQLGNFSCELVEAHGGRLIEDPMRLAALSSAAALVEAALPEREPHRFLYERLLALLRSLQSDEPGMRWPQDYVRWELDLLTELGFGLDLSRCAVTGVTTDLAFVSPRSGRAVSLQAAGRYRDRLLHLPEFLGGAGPAQPDEVPRGLALTGYFLEQHVFTPPKALPPARNRLVQFLERRK